ncbi:hypothetical protein AWC20_19810 [Mycobacterium parmense]|nr:hypothetical protein AWC20_19810 [Mycobacterium parmense]
MADVERVREAVMGLFISYASRDRRALDGLMAAFQRAHLQVWLDEELGGGEAWWRVILERIRDCDVFIVALSNNSLASKPCQAELRYAQALQRPILPVQVGPLDSMRLNPLSTMQIIDYRNPSVDTGIQLIAAVHEQRARVGPLPSPLPDEPPVPFAYLMRLAVTIKDPVLSARQQSELVSELKSALDEDGDDPAARRDLTQLLCMLRDRPDVTYRTRTDVESIIASMNAAEPASGPTPQPPFPPGPFPPHTSGPFPSQGGGPPPQPFTGPARPPFPGPTQHPAPTGRRSRTTWILAGAGALVAVVAIVIAAVVFWPHPHPTTKVVKAEQLDSILLTASDLNSIMGTSNMQQISSSHQMATAPTLSDPSCAGAADTEELTAYQGSDYQAVADRYVREPGTQFDHVVVEAAVTFSYAPNAPAFVRSSADKWKACAGKTVTKTQPDGKTSQWGFADVVDNDTKISVTSSQEGYVWSCQHTLSTVANVVIDANACAEHVTNEGTQIADKIATNATNAAK